MTEISPHLTLVTGQDREEIQSTANPTDAHNHNLRADTIPANSPHSTISHLKLNKEAEHRQENVLHISGHIQVTNLFTNKTGHHQVTHVGLTTINANVTNDVAEKRSRELINYMKKKVVEEQITRKKKKTENAMKSDDAKCNDGPTASNDANEQKFTEDHQLQRCKKTYLLKYQNRT
jgi:hypothetical protein